MNNVGTRIRQERERQGMSRHALAVMAGVSPYTLRRIEEGKPAQTDTVTSLLNALDLRVSIQRRKAKAMEAPFYVENLTPHAITVRCGDGREHTLEPSGVVARVAEIRTDAAIVLDGIYSTAVEYGDITDLPEPQSGCVFIVSAMVAQAARRQDVFSPGPLIRDADGRIIACDGLTRWA